MGKIIKLPHRKAEKTLADPRAMDELLQTAQKKAKEQQGKLRDVWKDLKLMIQMLKAYWRGEYRTIPYRSLAMAAAALIYFVNPFDLIPDPLLMGFIDDALVIGYVLTAIKSDLIKFAQYHAEVQLPIP